MSIIDLYVKPALEEIKASIIEIAESAELPVTSWILGDPSERWIEIAARVIDVFTSAVVTQYARGFFLDLSTDPGDEGDLSADQTPRTGWLSAKGASDYGTTRRGQTFAEGFVTLTNNSGASRSFYPGDFTFQRSTAGSDGGFPTYRNAPDPAIYNDAARTLTIANGASRTIPVVAETIGAYSNASPGQISIVVTGTFGSFSVTNSAPVTGEEREVADAYRARCRTSADAKSCGGPKAAYLRAATTALDGTPLQLYTGAGPVGITRVQVSIPDGTGTVDCYYAARDGACSTDDLDSAEANTRGIVKGVITDPIGVVPDAVTYTAHKAVDVPIHVSGTVKIKARPGLLASTVKQAIVDALGVAFEGFEVGGYDQDAGGNGVIYRVDLFGNVQAAYTGIYDVTIATPASATTALALGRVATLNSVVGDWTVTIV